MRSKQRFLGTCALLLCDKIVLSAIHVHVKDVLVSQGTCAAGMYTQVILENYKCQVSYYAVCTQYDYIKGLRI